MNYSDFKNQVDALMNLLWGTGVANHSTIIEQINYLVFLRSLTKKDDAAMKLDENTDTLFKGKLSMYRWDNLLMLNAEALFTTLEEAYKRLPELAQDKTIQLLFRDAHVKVYDKPSIRRLVHEIEKMMADLDKEAAHGHKDVFGDMYEYLLSKLAQAGTLGSFRTPRHIIKFIVDVIDPAKGETILDPACGTAGFLVAALEHLKHKYTSAEYLKQGIFPMDKLAPNERKFIYQHAITGYDSDFDMFKFGLMNLYLHQLEHPQIKRLNTLVDTAGDRTKWDVILANPPFAGAIEQESISEDIRMGTRATEILFLRFMIDHLSPRGRAGVIVPEGVIFSGSNAHKKIRQMLIEDAGLWAVISLPAGVFNPYAGVKTSIVFFDKSLRDKNKEILFIKIRNDGFDLGATKRPIDKNDIPQALEIIKDYRVNIGKQKKLKPKGEDISYLVPKAKIVESGDYNLSGEKYKRAETRNNHKWPMIEISQITQLFTDGNWIESKDQSDSGIRLLQTGNIGIGEYIDKADRSRFISESTFKRLNCTEIFEGDVLISRLPDPVGRACLVPNLSTRMITAVDCTVVRFDKKKILPKLFVYYSKTKEYYEAISQYLTGSSRTRISRSNLANVRIPLPPLEVQREIVAEMDKYQKEIEKRKNEVDLYQQKIKDKVAEVWGG